MHSSIAAVGTSAVGTSAVSQNDGGSELLTSQQFIPASRGYAEDQPLDDAARARMEQELEESPIVHQHQNLEYDAEEEVPEDDDDIQDDYQEQDSQTNNN